MSAALAAALLIILVLLMNQCSQPEYIPGQAAVIEKDEEVQLNDMVSGSTRIKLSPSVTVENGRLTNLNFCNYNEGRLMKCRILVEDTCIYESIFLKEGEMLSEDVLPDGAAKSLKPGPQEALVEVHTCTLEEEPVGQTNVKIKLTVK